MWWVVVDFFFPSCVVLCFVCVCVCFFLGSIGGSGFVPVVAVGVVTAVVVVPLLLLMLLLLMMMMTMMMVRGVNILF